MDMEEVQGVTEVVELLEGLVRLVDSMDLTFEEGSKSQPCNNREWRWRRGACSWVDTEGGQRERVLIS